MKRFKSILVAVDTRFEEHPALHWAVRLAEHNQAKSKNRGCRARILVDLTTGDAGSRPHTASAGGRQTPKP